MRSIHLPAQARGSSLVETLVATVLGLLVLVLTTNSVLAVVVGENRTGPTKALTASIEFARSEAIQRRSPVAMCGLDPRDAAAPSGQVRCAPGGAVWAAGWIVYGDENFNGELDDGEAVLQVSRESHFAIQPPMERAFSAAVTFRPLGTLASATPRRLLLSSDATQTAAVNAVCIGIDGYTRVMPVNAPCQ
jgi:Tfp pilus assembly protein FimT